MIGDRGYDRRDVDMDIDARLGQRPHRLQSLKRSRRARLQYPRKRAVERCYRHGNSGQPVLCQIDKQGDVLNHFC